jgi:protein-S-isoprenylcysteine O-methyltransferase Ste14
MSLGTRVVVQTAGMFGVLALALFASAGSFSFWNAWLFLALFFASAVAVSIYFFKHDRKLIERRLALAEKGEQTPTQRIAQPLLGLAFLGVLVLAGLDWRFGWSHVPVWVVAIAATLFLIAFLGIFFVLRANTFASSIVTVEREQRVIDTGPYAIVRHPMYTGGLLFLLAMPIMLGSWVAAASFPIFVLAILLRARDEERLLARDLPGYTDYIERVPYRLIPHVV